MIVCAFALKIRRVLSDYVEGPTLCGAVAALICLWVLLGRFSFRQETLTLLLGP
jgi:hypothetical protein